MRQSLVKPDAMRQSLVKPDAVRLRRAPTRAVMLAIHLRLPGLEVVPSVRRACLQPFAILEASPAVPPVCPFHPASCAGLPRN